MPTIRAIVLLTILAGNVHVLQAQESAADRRSQASISPIYDPNPDHIWNRVYAALMIRTGPDGKSYGFDRMEPLLWRESDSLLSGPDSVLALRILQEFIDSNGANQIREPLKKALLQRDLWMIANWAADETHKNPGQLLELLVQAIGQLALSPQEIAALPDNYAQAVAAKTMGEFFDPANSEKPYLPANLFDEKGPWVCVGRTDTRTAPLHLQQANPFSNSCFLVFVKFPGGRQAAMSFVHRLSSQKQPLLIQDRSASGNQRTRPNPESPQLPQGTELALVKRMLLIDNNGQVRASPITEGIQLRRLRKVPSVPPATMNDVRLVDESLAVFDLQLRRIELLQGRSGGLVDASAQRDFKTGFGAHQWDEFQRKGSSQPGPDTTSARFPERSQPFVNNRQSCVNCHPSATVYSTMSFQRYRAADERASDTTPPLFPIAVKTLQEVEAAAVHWKEQQPEWHKLRGLLRKSRSQPPSYGQ